MGEHGNTADLAHERQRVVRLEPGIWHMCGAAVGQIPIEGLLHRVDMSGVDHLVRNMRTTHLARRTGANAVPVHRYADLGEPVDDHANALRPKFRLTRHPLDQRLRARRRQIREQMHRPMGDLDRQLDSRKYTHTEACSGRNRLVEAFDRVMVGERHRRDTACRGMLHECSGSQVAVGGRRVAVQVDEGHATIGYRAMARIRPSDNIQPVYSTDSGRIPTERTKQPARARASAPAQGGPPKDGVVRVSRTSAGRGGKTVTLVTGVPPVDVTDVAARLKKLCGSGGTVKDGVIEIQGDHREKIAAHLGERYTTKLAGG